MRGWELSNTCRCKIMPQVFPSHFSSSLNSRFHVCTLVAAKLFSGTQFELGCETREAEYWNVGKERGREKSTAASRSVDRQIGPLSNEVAKEEGRVGSEDAADTQVREIEREFSHNRDISFERSQGSIQAVPDRDEQRLKEFMSQLKSNIEANFEACEGTKVADVRDVHSALFGPSSKDMHGGARDSSVMEMSAVLDGLDLGNGQQKALLSNEDVRDLTPRMFIKNLEQYIEEFGFSRDEFKQVVTKHPEVLAFDLVGVVCENRRTLVELGITGEELRAILLKTPKILAREFEDLEWHKRNFKLDNSALRKMVSKFPMLCVLSIDDQVKPQLDRLRAMGLGPNEIRMLVIGCPKILNMSIEQEFLPLIKKFVAYGMAEEKALIMLVKHPIMLYHDYEGQIKPKLDWLENVVGVDRVRIGQKILPVAGHSVVQTPLDRLENNYYFLLRKVKISKSGIPRVMCRIPQLLSRSLSDLEEKLDFAKRHLGRNGLEVKRCPEYLKYSFENRILFRVAFMDYKGVDYKFRSVKELFVPADRDLLQQFLDPCFSEFVMFKEWWEKLSREAKIEAFKTRKYDFQGR